MKISLNTYNKGQVAKTFEADSAAIMYGTVEDILNAVQVDKLNDNVEIAKMVVNVLPTVKPLLLDVFTDMTEDDLRSARINEIVPVVIDIVKSQITDLTALLPNQKQGN